jgi:hypothetical protein
MSDTTAPEASVIVPLSVPVTVCAKVGAAQTVINKTAKTMGE